MPNMAGQDFAKNAETLDRADVLHAVRDEFYLQPGVIYMDGNSLGLLSKPAERALADVLEAWKRHGIDGWLQGEHPWYYFAEKLGAMAAPLIGAKDDEVLIAGSTSSNLHQLLATFFKPQGKRTKILIEEAAFPTDAHIAKSQLALRGLDPAEHLVVVPSNGGTRIEERDVIASMSDEVAIAILPVALYRTGQILDVRKLTAEAHARGALICFDGCHSVGVMAHNFHDDGVDLGVFCTYKYLNGGPGATGGLFVHRKHLGTAPGIPGWFSSRKDRQFDMRNDLEPAAGVGAYQIGTPNIFSMAPLLGAIQLVNDIGIGRIRKKSLALTEFMIELIDSELAGLGFSIGTPRAPEQRGGHIALQHPEAARICKALKQRGVIPDFRPPNIVRLAPSPCYTSFAEVSETIAIVRDIAERKTYLEFPNTRDVVA
jgi:kynureninase